MKNSIVTGIFTLIGVIFGSGGTYIGNILIENGKIKRTEKKRKLEICQELIRIGRLLSHYIFLWSESDSKFYYWQRFNCTINGFFFTEDGIKKILENIESYRIKRIELLSEFNKLIIEYQYFFGDDIIIDEIFEKMHQTFEDENFYKNIHNQELTKHKDSEEHLQILTQKIKLNVMENIEIPINELQKHLISIVK